MTDELSRHFLSLASTSVTRTYEQFGARLSRFQVGNDDIEEVIFCKAAQAEIASTLGEHSAGILWDARKYYEKFNRSALDQRARDTGMDPVLVVNVLGHVAEHDEP